MRSPQGWGSTEMISYGRTDTNGKVLVNGVGEHLMPTAQMWRPLRPSSPVTAPDTRNSHTECGFALERVIARSGWFGRPSAAGPGARSRALVTAAAGLGHHRGRGLLAKPSSQAEGRNTRWFAGGCDAVRQFWVSSTVWGRVIGAAHWQLGPAHKSPEHPVGSRRRGLSIRRRRRRRAGSCPSRRS